MGVRKKRKAPVRAVQPPHLVKRGSPTMSAADMNLLSTLRTMTDGEVLKWRMKVMSLALRSRIRSVKEVTG